MFMFMSKRKGEHNPFHETQTRILLVDVGKLYVPSEVFIVPEEGVEAETFESHEARSKSDSRTYEI